MLWLLETGVFGPDYASNMPAAVESCGHQSRVWSDEWWATGIPDTSEPTVFHGSLANASRLAVGPLVPGAYCAVDRFRCSSWYATTARWLVHRVHCVLPLSRLVADPVAALATVGATRDVFVRPDSPLKPFAGRVLALDAINLAAVDHGFYFDDEHLPVVLAPVVSIGQEWRFVVVDGRVVAGSAYVQEGRRGVGVLSERTVEWAFAQRIADDIPSPQRVYVLDVCLCDGELRLLELNPFSGADLYDCDLAAVVRAVAEACIGNR